MKRYLRTLTRLLLLLVPCTLLLMTGCSGSGGYSATRPVGYGYGVYRGYGYYDRYYDDHDDYRHMDRNSVNQRREQRVGTRPQRQASMGRPTRAGRGGRR